MSLPGRPVQNINLDANRRTLAALRKVGLTASVCEQFVARVEGKGQRAKFAGGFRRDLFGFGDILAYDDHNTILVQATSKAGVSGHLRKYRRDPEIKAAILRWLALPGREFLVYGWQRYAVAKASGDGTKMSWIPTICEITAADL